MRLRNILNLLILPAAVASCQGDDDGEPGGSDGVVRVYVSPTHAGVIEDYVRHIDSDQIEWVQADDPAREAAEAGGVAIVLTDGSVCAECYKLDSEGTVFSVESGGILGLQYGLTDVLEAMNVRFFAPHSTYVPEALAEQAEGLSFPGETHEPEMSLRGVQLHTLHPVEGMYAFWMPGEANLEEAKVIADWYVKQRTNYIQWVGLDDINFSEGEDRAQVDATIAAWRQHTIAINDYLGQRGVRSGVNIQIFGAGNLQKSFDLLDVRTDGEAQTPIMRERLGVLLDGTGFDHVTLSFGEFFEVPASEFIDSINRAASVVYEYLPPEATMGSKIHVGNYPNTFVDYQGESYLFYFLAQFADERVVPWVHTVMYYNLYEDAGGAYLHDEFDLHRDMLLERLAAGQPVVYFPETAYWVAFDVSVPQYNPIYIKSRFVDLDETRKRAQMGGFADLDENVTFSSGFEWGFWQNDYTYQRMQYELAGDWRTYVDEMYAPFGEDGATLATAVNDLADLQHRTLMGQRLGAYLAGRDAAIDFGDLADILSQPDRVQFDEIEALDASGRSSLERDIALVETLATDTEAIGARLDGLTMDGGEVWLEEIRDGIAVDVARARYIAAVYRAAMAHVDGGDPQPFLATAQAEFAAAQAIVAKRHSSLWSPNAPTLVGENTNPSVYQHGYLNMADTLCYWERERVKVNNLINSASDLPPPCFDITAL